MRDNFCPTLSQVPKYVRVVSSILSCKVLRYRLSERGIPAVKSLGYSITVRKHYRKDTSGMRLTSTLPKHRCSPR